MDGRWLKELRRGGRIVHHGAARWLAALFLAAANAAGATPPAPLALAGGLFEHAPSLHRLPDLAFVDVNGHARHLADFRGRVILLNLWATWCPPCRRELPTLDHLQALLGGPDFEVVALSIDRGGLVAVTSYFDQFDVRALHVYVDASARALAKVGGIALPTTLLIGRDGRELARHVGPADWDRPDVVALLRGYIAAPHAAAPARARAGASRIAQVDRAAESAADVVRTTPAAFIRCQAPASDPDVSIARHASSTTTTSNPAARASSALHATQKSVASPHRCTFDNPRSRSRPARPVGVRRSASRNAE
jgi:thiol-disulfide isomerase/thioredoxin